MRFLNLNIANRLRLGFGLLLVFIAVIASVGMQSLNQLHKGTSDLADGVWPRARQANIALDNLRGSMGRIGQLVAIDDAAMRAHATERLNANIAAMDKALQDLEPLLVTSTGKALLAEAREQRKTYVALVEQVQGGRSAGPGLRQDL
jgi:methyl-accepting chemotaxis protein